MEDEEKDLPFLIALTMVNGVGNYLAKSLISYCGNAGNVFKETKSGLLKIPGIGILTAENIRKFRQYDDVEKELEYIQKHKIRAISCLSRDYPRKLKEIEDNPMVIFTRGEADLNTQRLISIVGTRNSTAYGKQFTDELIAALKPFDVVIASGLAAGTDTNVHKACLKNGICTIGVLGHGFSTVYPNSNKRLAMEMEKHGMLLTEFRFMTPGNRENFPRRNRLVAGMSDAVIVVESGIRGGSLITADLANQYNRDVFALPGKLTDAYSAGCNHLIGINQAAIIDSIPGLISQLGYDNMKQKLPARTADLFSDLNKDEHTIVSFLSNGQKGIDDIHYHTGIQMGQLAFILLDLEFRGIIRNHPGKIYTLTYRT